MPVLQKCCEIICNDSYFLNGLYKILSLGDLFYRRHHVRKNMTYHIVLQGFASFSASNLNFEV